MKTWLLLLGLLLATLLSAGGHDTSVLIVRFQELGDERYQLDYNAPPGSLQGEAPPVLPEHATWEQQPELPAGPVRLTFTTDGKPLSGEDRIVLPWRCSGVLVHAFWRSGEAARRFVPRTNEGIVLTIGELRAGVGGTGEAAKRYTILGVEHMLTGWDHLLFVAGLLLLVKGWRQVVATITAFNLAHSLTLALSTLGWLGFERGVVEVLIAFSIAVLAVEIIHASRGQAGITARKPWLVSFLFGLIHGLGFAGVMEDLGLPRQDIPVALLFFNVGVELGQLAMIGLWLGMAKSLRSMKLTLPPRLSWAPGYALGIIAMVWCLDRAVGLFC
ncbi:MAG: HupE/UreJ family protein [Verrucomicrobiaceae bacterium]|nr:MAG: HupE/UreJ family protein [Verrucomicrobiaceae bacterium]